jgi:hypothetical protein
MNFRRLNPPATNPSQRRALKDPEANSIHEDVIDSEEFSHISGDELDLLLFHVKECVKTWHPLRITKSLTFEMPIKFGDFKRSQSNCWLPRELSASERAKKQRRNNNAKAMKSMQILRANRERIENHEILKAILETVGDVLAKTF